jgi:hypothetical protein
LSAASVIEYDGQYFWCGTDRFLMFNGVVREIPNNLNINYFFDGLNRNATQKVFAYKVPRYGEIWWCYPRGDATECTHAVIFNIVRTPGMTPSCLTAEICWRILSFLCCSPIVRPVQLSDFVPNVRITQNDDIRITEDGTTRAIQPEEGYKVWQHEFGANEIDGQNITAVPSFFETADMSIDLVGGPSEQVDSCRDD